MNLFAKVDYARWASKPPKAFRDQYAFDLKLPTERIWDASKRRTLLVVEHVDSEDLGSAVKEFLTGPSKSWLGSAMDLGWQYATHLKPTRGAFAAINFNFFKTYDLEPDMQALADDAAAARVNQFIKEYGVTDVIVFGDGAARALMGSMVKDTSYLYMRRGRPIKRDGVWWTNTISPSLAYQGRRSDDDDDEEVIESKIDRANLLGFVGRCAGNALARSIVHKVEVDVKPVLINSMGKWRKLYDKLMSTPRFALDTEGTGLNRLNVTVLTMQFAFTKRQGFILPLDHDDAPWSKSEKLEIENGLRDVFGRHFDPLERVYDRYIIGHNLKFDLTVVRSRFGLFNIKWPCWDLMAGEYMMDENVKSLTDCSNSHPYRLDWVCAQYGWDFYSDNSFKKEDRTTIATRSLDEPGLLEYCAADVQAPWAIHDAQLERASYIRHKSRSYRDPFAKIVATQLSSIVHVESLMEQKGDQLDVPYLLRLKDRGGEFAKALNAVLHEFQSLPGVREANRVLVKQQGVSTKNLWGGTTWVFSPSKPAHKQLLFFQIMNLEPVTIGKSKQPNVDKLFQVRHKSVPEVSKFTELAQLTSLKNSYVNGFYKRLKTDPDMMVDHALRASYGFTGTVTGRSNSFNPNLQNIPVHGRFASFIKRMFVASRGHLTLKMDYSSHEVRMWGVVSGDRDLCALFVNGRWLRQQYRRTGDNAYKVLMNTKGDIHRVNCEFFFKVDAAKVTDAQRNSVKSIVFGAIYGRGPKAISEQTGQTVEQVKQLLVRFFKRFKVASAWLENAKSQAVKNAYVSSPIDRRRNMYSHMFGIDGLKAGAERRGCNAPIQGFSADVGHTAAYLYMHHIERVVKKFKLSKTKIPTAGINNFIHDAIKTSAPYEYLLVCLQVLQWCATIGVMEYYKVHWGVKFSVEVEVEFELSAHDASHWKWDWHEGKDGNDKGGGLRYCIRKSLEDQREVYSGLDIDAIEKTIWKVRDNKELVAYLDKHYPVLSDWPDATHIDTNSESFKTGLGATVKAQKRLMKEAKQ